MAVSKKRMAKIVADASKFIKGKSIKGDWVRLQRADGEDIGYTPTHKITYDRMRADLQREMKGKGGNEVPCQMCTEGALYVACALDGLEFVSACEIINKVSSDHYGGVGRIPNYNDAVASNQKQIEAKLAEVAQAYDKEA